MGEIELVPREERIFGPGASVIMAPFTHLNPEGSRFADDTFGAFYAAASLDTETRPINGAIRGDRTVTIKPAGKIARPVSSEDQPRSCCM